jgi:hypothetical protein
MRFTHLSILFTLTCLSHLSADEKEKRQPNILFILVDELRKPVVYESEDLQKWSRENLKAMSFLQDNGVTFDNHYCASTACAPSRTSLFTGQYPTFHGVSQTDGAAKPASDPTMFGFRPTLFQQQETSLQKVTTALSILESGIFQKMISLSQERKMLSYHTTEEQEYAIPT